MVVAVMVVVVAVAMVAVEVVAVGGVSWRGWLYGMVEGRVKGPV